MEKQGVQDIGKFYVKSYEELYNYLNENLKKIRAQSGEPFEKLMKRKLTYAYEFIVREFNQVHKALLTIRSSHVFFKELFEMYTGKSVEQFDAMVRWRVRVAKSIYEKALRELSKPGVGSREVIGSFKSSVGRLLSLYRRVNRELLLLKDYLKEVSRMPDIRGDYVVIIAGLPQVGKSTLLSKLTLAKPEIGVYPFTTRTLVAGHIHVEPYGRVVLVDSPGILDSPMEEKNLIERKAILAIRHLADHVLYLFAVYPGFYYTLTEQLNVYHAVRSLLGNKPITVLLNKVDLVEDEYLPTIISEIERSTGMKPIPISALTGFNLDEVREVLVKGLMDKIQHR